MADNVTLPGAGAVIASDEVSGAHYQVFKLAIGADGVANLLSDSYPVPVNSAHPNDWQAPYEFATAQTNYALKAAPGANLRLVITDVFVNSAIANDVKLMDGSGGTVLWRMPSVAAGGGSAPQFKGRLKLTSNTGLYLTSTGTGNAFILVLGYTEAA